MRRCAFLYPNVQPADQRVLHDPAGSSPTLLAAVVKQTLRSIWKYVVPYRGRFAMSLLLGMLGQVRSTG